MVSEHFLGGFIQEDPSSEFSKLFQAIVVAHDDILRSVALVLGVSILLAMVTDALVAWLVVQPK
jgi:hypothetical protein